MNSRNSIVGAPAERLKRQIETPKWLVRQSVREHQFIALRDLELEELVFDDLRGRLLYWTPELQHEETRAARGAFG